MDDYLTKPIRFEDFFRVIRRLLDTRCSCGTRGAAFDPKRCRTELGVSETTFRRMYRQLGNFNKALECFNKAIAINPGHIIAQFNKSIVLEHDKHDKAGALAALKDLAARNPNAILPGGATVAQAIQELSGQ